VVSDFHFDYFVQATSMRSILGKDYVKESENTKLRPPKQLLFYTVFDHFKRYIAPNSLSLN